MSVALGEGTGISVGVGRGDGAAMLARVGDGAAVAACVKAGVDSTRVGPWHATLVSATHSKPKRAMPARTARLGSHPP